MSLDLDPRQRAMLQEMGVRVWWPRAGAPAPDRVVTKAPDKEQRVVLTPSDDIASMDWQELGQAVQQCQACKQRLGRRSPVFAGANLPRRADWLVLGEPPDDNEERLGTPFAGQAGQLLDNMLKAVGVSRRASAGDATDGAASAAAAYVSNVVKCRPAIARNPEPQDLGACEKYLRREVTLVQPKVILALGRFAAQALLQDSRPDIASIPLGKLRGQVYRYQGIPVVVSYHPAYLLRTPQDKARAWLDLCLALQCVEQRVA